MQRKHLYQTAVVLCSAAVLAACGGSSSESRSITVGSPSVEVRGLDPAENDTVTVTLSGEDLVFTENETRSFDQEFVSGTSYTITITDTEPVDNCLFTNGTDSFSGSNAEEDLARVRCGDELDPPDEDEDNGEEEPAEPEAGTLEKVASGQHAPDIVSTAFRITDPATGDIYTGTLDNSDFSVFANGQEVLFGGDPERLAWLDPDPEVVRGFRIAVDVSNSMFEAGVLPDISQALQSFHQAQGGAIEAVGGEINPDQNPEINQRMLYYWFPDNNENDQLVVSWFVNFMDEQLVEPGDLIDATMETPLLTTTNVLDAADRLLADSEAPATSPLQTRVRDELVLITDGEETARPDFQGTIDATDARLTIIAYGQEQDVNVDFLEGAFEGARIERAENGAELLDLLEGLMNEQDERAAGIRSIHTALPERAQEQAGGDKQIVLESGTLCDQDICAIQSDYNPSAFDTVRGTTGSIDRPDVEVGALVKVQVHSWRDDWIEGCAPPYGWSITDGDANLIETGSGDYRIVDILDDQDVNVRVDSGGAAGCEHVFEINVESIPEP